MLAVIKKNWFLIGIVFVICFAKLAPGIGAKGGILKPEITVKYIAVFIIFFNSGISLKSEELGKALLQVKVHVFVQVFTFMCFPILIFTLVEFLKVGPINQHILEGFQILSCMPPPVSSAVILTKAVGGNEAAAIFNSAFGSFMGIFVTPTLILSLVGSKADVPVGSIFSQLTMTVVVPLLIGQWLRRLSTPYVDVKNVPWGQIGSAILLMIIYTTFCDTFSHKDIDVDPSSLVLTVLLVICLQCSLLYSVYRVSSSKFFPFARSDTVALMFCCTHKSLTLGIPIIKSIFANSPILSLISIPHPDITGRPAGPLHQKRDGIPIIKIIFADSPSLSLISIPLLVYHPTQILLGGLLIPKIRKWMLESQTSSGSQSVTASV